MLCAQRFKARGEAVAAMKAEGIEYEDRMELLEEVDYPKPLADLIEVAYEAYRKGAPWIAEYQPEPKSVIRDMYERAMTFSEYVAFYTSDPVRGGGVAVLRRRLPGAAPHRADRRPDRGAHRHHLLAGRTRPRSGFQPARRMGGARASGRRRADSPGTSGEVRPPLAARGISANERGFTVMVRNALFRRVELLARAGLRRAG